LVGSERCFCYPLHGGYVHNWLVAGPHAVPAEADLVAQGDARARIIGARHSSVSDVHEPPVEGRAFQVGGERYVWRYCCCTEDHEVDLGGFYPTYHYLRAWAYARLSLSQATEVRFTLATHGAADVWVNGEHTSRQEEIGGQEMHSVAFERALDKGENEVLVRLERTALGACPFAMALHVAGADDAMVLLPTDQEYVSRFQELEHIFDQAYLERAVYHRGNRILLHWADDLDTVSHYVCQIQNAGQHIYVEALPIAEPSNTLNIGHPARIWEGAYDVVLRPRPEEWFVRRTRYERRFPIHILDTEYAAEPYGTLEGRRIEALEYVAKRGTGLSAQIARMELGRWAEVDVGEIMDAVAAVDRREVGSVATLVQLLGMIYRYGEDPAFPEELREVVERCAVEYRYQCDVPLSVRRAVR